MLLRRADIGKALVVVAEAEADEAATPLSERQFISVDGLRAICSVVAAIVPI